jgi:hypothetical protein
MALSFPKDGLLADAVMHVSLRELNKSLLIAGR